MRRSQGLANAMQVQMIFDGVMHSRCVQAKIDHPGQAGSAFNDRSAGDIALVAVPRSAAENCCCCYPILSVPSGFFVLYQKWYSNMGSLDPGVRWCWPFWYRISHMVNKATITYLAPSAQVPTADNVMIDINLSVTFEIGPDVKAAESFVYSLGTSRFDEFLANEVEEGIRGLVYSVTHDRVNDLREEFAQGMLASLSRKFVPYGVQIKNVKITETRLPRDLARLLEETTTFRTRIGEKAKKHETTIRVLADQASQELETLMRTNQRREQDLTAACAKYEIEHREKVDEAVGAARVQEMAARSRMDVMIGQAQGDLKVAVAEGDREAESIRTKAQIESDQRRIKIEENAAVLVLESEGQLRAAENDAQAFVAEAEAENKSTAGLEVKRKYLLEWERLEVLQRLAGEGRRFVSGPAGQEMMREMTPVAFEFDKSRSKPAFF
jgi:regulator of protease activity HflC (stomatin/prohibitin superfamily)